MPYDRFAPESYEDYVCRGKTALEIAIMRQEQADEAARRAIEEAAEEFAAREEQQAVEGFR